MGRYMLAADTQGMFLASVISVESRNWIPYLSSVSFELKKRGWSIAYEALLHEYPQCLWLAHPLHLSSLPTFGPPQPHLHCSSNAPIHVLASTLHLLLLLPGISLPKLSAWLIFQFVRSLRKSHLLREGFLVPLYKLQSFSQDSPALFFSLAPDQYLTCYLPCL